MRLINDAKTVPEALNAVLFYPPDNTLFARFFSLLAIIILYLVGVAHWLVFFCTAPNSFAFRVMNFSAYQWPREFVFLSTLQDAVVEGVIPYHIFYPMKETTRFLGIPDYIISPQILLLGTTDIATFVLVNTVFLYSLSFIGCLLIKKRYQLSLFSFSAMYLLLNFNGNITAQLGAGHYVWAGFFLLPFYCLFVLELIEGKHSLSQSIKLALILFVMILQGTYHFYTWGVMFLLLLALFAREHAKPILIAVALSVPLVAVRVLPAAMTFWGAEREFLSGYPTLLHLLEGLIIIKPHTTETVGVLHNLSWWEYDFYIGLLGLAFVGYGGIYLRFKKSSKLEGLTYKALDMPMLLMSLFSLSIFYAPITYLPLPLFGAERVSSRFLIIPILMLIVLAAIRLNQTLPQWIEKPVAKLLALFGLAQLGLSLAMHTNVWRVSVLEQAVTELYDLAELDAGYNVIIQHDPWYVALVNGSALMSFLTLLLLLALWRWDALKGSLIQHE